MGSEILKRLTARARTKWSSFAWAVSNEELDAFIAARVSPERLDDSVLAEDLLLACACAKGVRTAHDELWQIATPEIDRAHARLRPSHPSGTPITRDEARTVVLDRLLLAPEGGAARIATYKGEGELTLFIRSLATRSLLNMASGRKGPESLEDAILRVTPPGGDPDPELELIKRTHVVELRASLGLGVATLDPRERALLRYAVVEELGVDVIGLMYGVPKEAATRWVQTAREKLELRVRKHLGERLRVSDKDLTSAARCMKNQLDLSLARSLGA